MNSELAQVGLTVIQELFRLPHLPAAVWDSARDAYVLVTHLHDLSGAPCLLTVCGERMEGKTPAEACRRAFQAEGDRIIRAANLAAEGKRE